MSLFRDNVDKLTAYTPGEQPQEPGWVKLNTNENPYPPSPHVVEAIERMAKSRLNVYPDPLGKSFCRAAGELFGVDADWILPANGSDENLTLLMRAFVDPKDLVAYPYPSYILYETLAEIQAARFARLRLNADWSWNLRLNKPLIQAARLLLVPNPNSPSGNRWDEQTVAALVPPQGILVLDEAYGDFADVPHKMEMLHTPLGEQMVVTRTFSKSYSLAGIRFGFAVARPELIRGMRKVKDSYNCDAISLAVAEAAIRDQAWMLANRAKIIATRTYLTDELRKLGFDVVSSQANFVWTTRAAGAHQTLYEQLKQRKILVRYMKFQDDSRPDGVLDGLRITIGTDEEISTLLENLKQLV